MRLQPSALVTKGAPLFFLVTSGTRGLLPELVTHRWPRCGVHDGVRSCLSTRRGVDNICSQRTSGTIMQLGRRRSVDQNLGTSPQLLQQQQRQQVRKMDSQGRQESTPLPLPLSRPPPSAAAATAKLKAKRRGRGVPAKPIEGRRRNRATPPAATAVNGLATREADVLEGGTELARGTGTSAMQGLRHSVKGLPRLSREEEMALCEDVQRWLKLEKLRKDVSEQGTQADGGGQVQGQGQGAMVGVEAWAAAAGVTVADLRELVGRGKEASQRLVLSHIRLVMYLAGKRRRGASLSSLDLVQEGAIALHLALERFDPGRGVRFFTYADWSLRAAFEKAEAAQATTIAMPRYVYMQKRRLKAILGQDCAPQTQQDLAESLDISEQRVTKLLRWANDCHSVDRELISGGKTLGEVIPSAQSSEAILRRLDAEATMVRLLTHLKPQEEHVIIHRYGLFGTGRKSNPAVASIMGLSRQYVGRVHNTALNKMRASLEEDFRCTGVSRRR